MKVIKPVSTDGRSFNEIVLFMEVGYRVALLTYCITRIPNGWIYESITANTTPFLLFVPETLPVRDGGTIYTGVC